MLVRRACPPCPRLPSARMCCGRIAARPPATPLGARRLASTASAGCPYRLLGVTRGCSEAELKKAFRLAAKRHHPDTQQGPDAAEAEQRFKQVAAQLRPSPLLHRTPLTHRIAPEVLLLATTIEIRLQMAPN